VLLKKEKEKERLKRSKVVGIAPLIMLSIYCAAEL
jgi:hypothetical protein